MLLGRWCIVGSSLLYIIIIYIYIPIIIYHYCAVVVCSHNMVWRVCTASGFAPSHVVVYWTRMSSYRVCRFRYNNIFIHNKCTAIKILVWRPEPIIGVATRQHHLILKSRCRWFLQSRITIYLITRSENDLSWYIWGVTCPRASKGPLKSNFILYFNRNI